MLVLLSFSLVHDKDNVNFSAVICTSAQVDDSLKLHPTINPCFLLAGNATARRNRSSKQLEISGSKPIPISPLTEKPYGGRQLRSAEQKPVNSVKQLNQRS